MDALDWDIGISMLSNYDDDDFLEAQIDAMGGDDSGVHPYELHHLYGFEGRPLDPVKDDKGVVDPTQSNQLLFALEGGKGHAFALQNPAVVKKLPALKKGESLQYGWRGQFVRCLDDGSIGMWAPATDGGVDFAATLGADGVFFTGRWGTFELSDNGFHVKHASGARIDLGGMSGLPAPLSSLSSYCNLTGSSIELDAVAPVIGATGVGQVSLVGATTLASMLTQIQSALIAVGAALTGGSVPATGVIAGAPAAATAIAASSTVLAALTTPGFATNAKGTI